MINIIIYEKNNYYLENCVSLIEKYFFDKVDKYSLIKIEIFSNKVYNEIKGLDGKKIFVIAEDMALKSGFMFAKWIRSNDDWVSPIIIIGPTQDKINFIENHLLILDYVNKDDNFNNNFIIPFEIAYKIIRAHKSLDFKYLGEYFRIPYDDIIYIEKDYKDNYSIVHTNNNKYVIKECINGIYSKLNDQRFFKSYRSCIINLNKISSIDFSNNIIYFDNFSITLLSRERKKNLKNLISI